MAIQSVLLSCCVSNAAVGELLGGGWWVLIGNGIARRARGGRKGRKGLRGAGGWGLGAGAGCGVVGAGG